MQRESTSAILLEKVNANLRLTPWEAEWLFVCARPDDGSQRPSYEDLFGISKAEVRATDGLKVPAEKKDRLKDICHKIAVNAVGRFFSDIATLRTLGVEYTEDKLLALQPGDLSSMLRHRENQILTDVSLAITLDRPVSFETLCHVIEVAKMHSRAGNGTFEEWFGVTREHAKSQGSVVIARASEYSRKLHALGQDIARDQRFNDTVLPYVRSAPSP